MSTAKTVSGTSGSELLLVKLSISHENLVFGHTLEAVPEAGIRTDCRLDVPDSSPVFYEIRGENRDAIETAMREDQTIADSKLVTAGDNRLLYRVVIDSETETISSRMAKFGLQPLGAESDDAGWTVRLQASSRDALSRFYRHCRARNIDVEVERLSQTEGELGSRPLLSDEQRRTLITAYESGYFDVPRSTSQTELAQRFGITGSAVSQRLRRAVAQLISDTLRTDH